MKHTDIENVIKAHYESEENFQKMIERLVAIEMAAGREISASSIKRTLAQYSSKKMNGYTKPMQSLNVLNRQNDNMVEVRQSDIKLEDIIVPEKVMKSIKEIINEYQNRELLQSYGLEAENKILLSGPPGVGKTWTAMAIAGELDMDLLFIRWDTLVSSYLGTTGANIRKVFESAQERPVVLFLDEFDAVGKERGGQNQEVGEMSRVVINLLQNIDMFPPNSFLIAATNHGHLLDTAVWRRFTVVELGLPGESERRRLIEYYAKGLPLQVKIDDMVKKTDGLSGAEIKARIQTHAKKVLLVRQSAAIL